MSAPAPAARPSWAPEALLPFRSRFLEVAGARVHYLDEGAGPTLLLLHGNPTWSFLYRDVIRALSGRFRCVAPDYPGFGLSRAPAGYDFRPESHARVVEGLVDALGLEDLTLVVQDWGGPIGLTVAVRRPARVKALVIGNTWAWPVNGDPHFEAFSRLLGGRLGWFCIRRWNAFVNLVLRRSLRRRPTPEVLEAYRGPFSTPEARWPTHVFPREILGSRDLLARVEAGLPALRERPALIVWGARDPAFRLRERRRFQALFPRHRLVVLPEAGHYLQEDAPAELAAAIATWWDEEVAGHTTSGSSAAGTSWRAASSGSTTSAR